MISGLKAQNLVPNPSFEEVDSLPCSFIQGTFFTDRIVLPMEQYPDGLYYVRITRGEESVVKRIYIKN
jgi:hypothetical protein